MQLCQIITTQIKLTCHMWISELKKLNTVCLSAGCLFRQNCRAFMWLSKMILLSLKTGLKPYSPYCLKLD